LLHCIKGQGGKKKNRKTTKMLARHERGICGLGENQGGKKRGGSNPFCGLSVGGRSKDGKRGPLVEEKRRDI